MLRFIGRWFVRLTVLAVLGAFAVAGFLFWDYKRFLAAPVLAEKHAETFAVQSGDTIAALMKRFPEAGIQIAPDSPLSKDITSYYFRFLAKSSDKAHLLKVGEYALTEGMTAQDLLDTLVSGKTVSYKVQFIEGWTFKQLREAIRKHPNIEQTLENVPDAELMQALKLGDGKAFYEGQFFPDTYQFPNKAKDADILKQAYGQLQANLQKAWDARDPDIILKTPYELLILASIIEKETGVGSERDKVSGVFHRRLKKGMLLQTDPTVIYGMGDKYQGTLLRKHLKTDTPYNTYTRKGLPPTPIALPSLASLMAAGQPDDGTALYFMANGTGGHTFSDTYKAHQKAVKAYWSKRQQK